MTTLTFRHIALAACALAAAVLSAGCSTQVDGTGSASAPHTTTKSKAPTSEPVPASTRPSAEDGTNYQACFGGDCEISVSQPVTITLSDSPVDAGPLTVQKINADSVDVQMGLPGAPSIGTAVKTGCTTAFYANNASGLADTSCMGEPGDIPGMYVKQLVTVEAITDGTAILAVKSE